MNICKKIEITTHDEAVIRLLENLAFQMVREKVGEAFYTPENAPWQTLLDTLLDNLDSKEKLIILASKLGSYQEPDDYYLLKNK